MINIENAKKEFIKYTTKFNLKDENIERKQKHSLRVMEISEEIAKRLGLSEKQIQLAALIGLLHDIARFEQYTKYKTFKDYESIDHGDYGAEILKKDIRKYIETDKYDKIILLAVKNHNKYSIEEGLKNEERLFSQIVRDADKIDIIFEAVNIFWKKDDEVSEIENGKFSEKMLKDFYNLKNLKLSNIKNRGSKADQIIKIASFIFDINFKCSLEMLKESDNINKMIDKFEYRIPETKEEICKIKKLTNNYIKEKTK